jgi:two-component system sensor histidine kinase DesK
MSLMVGYITLHEAQNRRADARLRLAHDQIEHLAAVAERERIGRDLHDLLGHTLSLIVLKSELAAKLATRDPERAAREIKDVEQVARRALREVREAIRGYRASLAEEVGQARSILAAAGIRAHVDAERADLPREAEEALALALREAVTNVVRHSRADTCRVELRVEGGACTLVVDDDGHGTSAPEGSGLRGMRERIAAAGGTVHRGPGADGRGVRMEASVPAGMPASLEAR